MAQYGRIILKLSGEALAPIDRAGGCYDPARVAACADMITRLRDLGVQVGVVLGGGNIWRGRFSERMNPVNADQMGMLATVMNALCLEDALNAAGTPCDVFSAQEMNRFTQLYTARAADACLSSGRVALLSGGTGNPFFTTDTGAALRAAELKCDAVFKGTTVDGVYDDDPRKNPNAQLLKDLTYAQCIERGLNVMDTSAFQLCMERGVKTIRVFSMANLENVLKVAQGEMIGSTVHA
ncbi:MAG: UMP kinase [Clostridia bacterium]